MKRPKLKKASKRLTCAKRFKIQKKVRAHNRKVKKEAKKKGLKKPAKKDLGVPSSAPFKEEVLREAEQRRLRIEEEKERQRQTRKEEKVKKRKNEDTVSDEAGPEAEPKAKKTRKEKATRERNVYKGSLQYMCDELNKVIDASDVIIEVLDAQDPLGYRCPQLEEAVLQREGNKKLLIVLNKIDLVPQQNVTKWIEYLEKELPVVAFQSSTKPPVEKTKSRKRTSSDGVSKKSPVATCPRSRCLIDLLNSYAETKKSEAKLKVGVVGFPNVGKSSLINTIRGTLACNAGEKRGLTKSMQEVHISKNIILLDSPGIVASPTNPPMALALRSLQMEDNPESVLKVAKTLIEMRDKTKVMLEYIIPNYRNSFEFLDLFARKRGYLQKGGVVSINQAAIAVLNEWTGPKLSYHCKVPGSHILPDYLSDAVVAEMQAGWNVKKLKAQNEKTLRVVGGRKQPGNIGLISEGPTNGILTMTWSEEKSNSLGSEDKDKQTVPGQSQADTSQTVDSENPKETTRKKAKQVKFQLLPVEVNLTATSNHDAYDFNTDFK